MTRRARLSRKGAVVRLVCIAAVFSIILVAIQSSLFTGPVILSREEIQILSDFQSNLQQCVANRGLGLTAHNIDHCNVILKFPQGTNSTWLDSLPDGWFDYAAKRIAQLGADKCYNQTLCEEHLNLILPAKPPFHPRQFRRCAVKYAKHVGLKRDFRLVVRGAARNMIKILNGSDDEVLIIKSVIHRDFTAMIKKIQNPVYLFQGIVLRRGAKGTGMKSIELALFMCDIVDIYGFTVDPGYTEWTRYFSTPRKGHNPLQGRAYYQLLECLGVIRIHSPMRAKRKQDWSDVPSREMINNVHRAALRLKKKQPGQEGGLGQFVNCKVWGKSGPCGTGPVSGSADMTDTRKHSNYNQWEILPFESLRDEARKHYTQTEGVSLYKMDGNKLDDLVCVKHPLKSEA
ncbi:unnamed protein product [Withania somnifera]